MALQSQMGKLLDSITCTTVPCDIHQWYNDILSSVEHGSKCPRGADIKVPNASSNYDDFISIGMKKSILTGMHGHRFCCEKGKKKKYMCCLVFKRGLHTWNTCLLLMRLTKCTLSQIVLFKLDMIFFRVLCIRKGLLRTDSMYSRVPGDQEDCFFSHLVNFVLALVFVQIELLC